MEIFLDNNPNIEKSLYLCIIQNNNEQYYILKDLIEKYGNDLIDEYDSCIDDKSGEESNVINELNFTIEELKIYVKYLENVKENLQ